jgi:hypothetical protein
MPVVCVCFGTPSDSGGAGCASRDRRPIFTRRYVYYLDISWLILNRYIEMVIFGCCAALKNRVETSTAERDISAVAMDGIVTRPSNIIP